MLSPRQEQIFTFIRSLPASPTLAEIRRHFGFKSDATVDQHLGALERKGYIHRTRGQARNIELTAAYRTRPAVQIPLFGAVTAGRPADAGQEPPATFAFDAALLDLPANARVFGLRVRGDSMVNAGIYDGDFVILEERGDARPNDVVAALIDGETTLKRYVVEHGQPFLKAENPRYPDLIPAWELVIQGVFRALVRVAPGGRDVPR